ncbi:MAG TPA: M48 family metalloprotease [Acidobacteriaceae bacterium]|nr:M48 family metalloprotease [Acidobacteriaceae bacterium]
MAATPLCPGAFALAAEDPAAAERLTDAQEILLGRRFAAAFEAESPILSNPLIDQRVNQVARELAAVSRRPTLPYHVKVLDLSGMNAVSLPGGPIYIHRGMLEALETEDELAAVLAHEIGHIVARHALRQIFFALRAQALLKPLLEELARQNKALEGILQQLGGAVALLARLSFAPHDELEADHLGVTEMLRADWDPRGFLTLLAALQARESAAAPTDQPLLRTHPVTTDRIAAIQRELASITIPEDARTDSLEFRACKQALLLLGSHPAGPHGL